MKIGILTHYNVNNQGAQLQMLSLKKYFEKLGHDVCILTYEKNFDYDLNEKKRNSGSFSALPYYIKEYLLKKGIGLTLFNYRKVRKHRKALNSLEQLPYDNNDCDAVIIGSDEVFSLDVGCNRMMFGYGLDAKPVIAYAPSFGRTTESDIINHNCYDLIKNGLTGMYRLSARDDHTKQLIFSLTGKDVPIVCDPVILYDGKDVGSYSRMIKKDYLLVYSYDRNMNDKEEIKAIKSFAKKCGLITASVGTYHRWCDKNIVCNADEWYSYFRYASFIVTDTFHGTVASLKNERNTAVFIREGLNNFKLSSLLDKLGAQNRKIESITFENLERIFAEKTDYESINRNIQKMRQISSEYLKEGLEKIK